MVAEFVVHAGFVARDAVAVLGGRPQHHAQRPRVRAPHPELALQRLVNRFAFLEDHQAARAAALLEMQDGRGLRSHHPVALQPEGVVVQLAPPEQQQHLAEIGDRPHQTVLLEVLEHALLERIVFRAQPHSEGAAGLFLARQGAAVHRNHLAELVQRVGSVPESGIAVLGDDRARAILWFGRLEGGVAEPGPETARRLERPLLEGLLRNHLGGSRLEYPGLFGDPGEDAGDLAVPGRRRALEARGG